MGKRIVKGWEGRYFEDLEPGDVYVHPYGRTVTETDNVWLTLLTMSPNEIHVNTDYSRETERGRPLVNNVLTLAIVLGLSVLDVSQNAINLGFEEVKFLNPVFAGDTLYAQSEALEKRESRSRLEIRDEYRQGQDIRLRPERRSRGRVQEDRHGVEERLHTEEEVDGEGDDVRRGATIAKVSHEIGDKRKRSSPNHSLYCCRVATG
ncbi:MAG: MaoC family dehydratase [Candidatus Caldarchaeales archaeon]